jgi:HlyD family secretion protein
MLMIILVISVLASLPLVKVHMSVSGRGIIRPVQERTSILAGHSGKVSGVFVREGDEVRKSDPILQISSGVLEETILAVEKELTEARRQAMDLSGLTSDPPELPASPRFKASWEAYAHQLDYLALIEKKARKELGRNAGLFSQGLISEKAFDDLRYAAERATKERINFVSMTVHNWQEENEVQKERIRALEEKINLLKEKVREHTIRAPANGRMIRFNGIFEGSSVMAGSVIGMLSPESELVGEFYIHSRNLAFLRDGQTVHIHLDAFNAREWGYATGHIYAISSDYILHENQPVYRVKCHIQEKNLRLRNGYSASIRKGMTFQARCIVCRRSLLRLIMDRTENWLNPALHLRISGRKFRYPGLQPGNFNHS